VILSDSTLGTGLGAPHLRYLNDIRFIRYHKFASTARLLGEDAADAGAAGAVESSPLDQPNPWLELDASEEPTQPSQPDPPVESAVQGVVPPLTIRTTTDLVEVPVIVRNRRGDPVLGLSKGDFQIFDNAKPQEVRFFGREEGSHSCSQAAAPPDPLRVLSLGEDRISSDLAVIVIDQINTNWADLAYARQEVAKFLSRVPPAKTLGVYTMDLGGFTRRADLAPAVSPVYQPDGKKSERTRVKGAADSGRSSASGDSLAVLISIANHLARTPGRKSLIWISAGFPEGSHEKLLQAVKVFNDANLAIYSVDAPGLQTAFPDASVSAPTYSVEFAKSASETHTTPIHANQSTMLELSSRTGGRAFLNANDIRGAIEAAFNDFACSYRLGFYPQGVNTNGEYHEIEVRLLGHPGSRLRYRHGYLAKQ
jgi:VWFA-related protein